MWGFFAHHLGGGFVHIFFISTPILGNMSILARIFQLGCSFPNLIGCNVKRCLSFLGKGDTISLKLHSKKTPEKICLEDYFPFGFRPIFQGRTVNFRKGMVSWTSV